MIPCRVYLTCTDIEFVLIVGGYLRISLYITVPLK